MRRKPEFQTAAVKQRVAGAVAETIWSRVKDQSSQFSLAVSADLTPSAVEMDAWQPYLRNSSSSTPERSRGSTLNVAQNLTDDNNFISIKLAGN